MNILPVKGITRRWILNVVGIVVAIIIVLELGVAFFVQNYYYDGIRQGIYYRSRNISGFFSGSEEFGSDAKNFVENFADKEKMEVTVVDANGRAMVCSTGFTPPDNQSMPDYDQVISGKNKDSGEWVGKLPSGETVMAVSCALTGGDGQVFGAVRYVVSLQNTDRQVAMIVVSFILIGIAIFLFVMMSGVYFINSIVKPVREIGKTARLIAMGDFNARIVKPDDDEIGELCDTINYMASELGEAERIKNDFISSVSHELRTPLTAIKGWAETVKDTGVTDISTINKGMNVIVGESERLSGLVEDLLDFSRMQSGRLVLKLEKMDVIAELTEAVLFYDEQAKKQGVTLKFDETGKIGALVGDKNRLRQVFVNIIDNAVKYTPSGGYITVSADIDSDQVYIIVKDTGEGIPSGDLPRVKEKFYKSNKNVRGSGIGLAVADEIVRMHGGSLQLDSQEGVGTEVTIMLPNH